MTVGAEPFSGIRLAVARKRRGLTKRSLGRLAELTERSLSDFEKGARVPNAVSLRRLAGVLGFPVGFFTAEDLDQPPVEATSFRALSKLTTAQKDQGFASATLALELARWIQSRFTLPAADGFPVMREANTDPETAAEAVRSSFGLGERSIPNMIHLLEAHGVRIFSLAPECRELDAFSFWLRGTPYIFLNTLKTAERIRMDAAHELGHLVMHSRYETPRGPELEREANEFGAAFLMPRGSVLAHAPRGARIADLVRAKRHWGVSLASLVYRMHFLHLLNDWQYRTLFVEISRRGYRTSEPESIVPERSQVLDKVFKALRDEGISKADVAEELRIPVTELTELVFGLVLTSVQTTHQAEHDRKSAEAEPSSRLRLVE